MRSSKAARLVWFFMYTSTVLCYNNLLYVNLIPARGLKMYKLANQILDIYDDSNTSFLRKLAEVRPHTEVLSPEDRALLGDHQFALSVITKKAAKLNKYPVSDRDSTWLSDAYFQENSHKLSKQAAGIAAFNIKSACERFGLKPSKATVKLAASNVTSNQYYEEAKPEFVAQGATELDMSKFAQVTQIGDNDTAAAYVFKSPGHVKVGAEYFERTYKDMPVEYRHKYAAALQKRAHDLGMPNLKGTVSKYASDYYSSAVDAHIRSRVSLLDGRPEVQGQLSKLGSAKASMSPMEFAGALAMFDKTAGLSRYYGAYLTNPYEATFASEPDYGAGQRVKVAGKHLSGDEIRALATSKYAKIKEYFGSHLADELKKHPTDIFESLPNDSKAILAGIANGTH